MSRRIDRELQALMRKMEPQVARAFIAAIRDLTSNVRFNDLIAAIERNDLEAAIRAIDMEPAVFARLTGTIAESFSAGGAIVAGGTAWRGATGGRVVVRWDMANPRAEKYIREMNSKITGWFTNEAREIIRDTMANGYALGRGPRQIGLELVGRVTPNGRQGGVVGLSAPQAKYVQNMRKALEENPRSYFVVNEKTKEWEMHFTKADKRYNAMIKRAAQSGEPLSRGQIDKITQRYSDRLLKLRGDTIARTETAQAVEAGRFEAFEQYQEKTGVPDEAIVRRWDHAGGKTSRDWHDAMNGMEVIGLSQPFITPRGAALMFPCDTSLGAGADEVVNCRCAQVIRINYKALKDG